MNKQLSICFLSILFVSVAIFAATPAKAYGLEDRTVNWRVLGVTVYPEWLVIKPPHDEFSTRVSNHDLLNDHPVEMPQWDASAKDTFKNLEQGRILSRLYLRQGVTPVIEVGSNFYKLSKADQQALAALVAQQNDTFNKGHEVIILTDWQSQKIIGTYSQQGLQLN